MTYRRRVEDPRLVPFLVASGRDLARVSRRAATAVLAIWFCTAAAALAQPAPERGPRHVDPRWHAITGATVVPRPGARIANATIVIRDGLVRSVTANGAVPAGARVHDLSGHTIYAGFVESHVAVDAPAPPADARGNHPHPGRILPQRRATDGAGLDGDTRGALRELGFAAAAIAPRDGNLRGRAAIVTLADPGSDLAAAGVEVVRDDVYQTMSFDRASFRSDSGSRYPTSQMGAIALLRQTFSDADWYHDCRDAITRDPARFEPLAPSDALEAIGPAGSTGTPILFDSRSELELLRAAKIADEFQRPMILLGSGTEFRRLDAIAATGRPLLVPLAFPETPDVADVTRAERVDLRTLMSWDRAPSNVKRLLEAGVDVALTSGDARDRGSFLDRLRRIVREGVDPDVALAMLTTKPAEWLGVADRIGTIEPGRLANLVVVEGDLFDDDATIRSVWIAGRAHEVEPVKTEPMAGTYTLDAEALGGALTLEIGAKRIRAERGETDVTARNTNVSIASFRCTLDGDDLGAPGVFALRGWIDGDVLRGTLITPTGESIAFTAPPAPPVEGDDPDESEEAADEATDPASDDAGEPAIADAEVLDSPPNEAVTDDATVADADAQRDEPARGERRERRGRPTDDTDETTSETEPALGDVLPLGAYGLAEAPASESLYITGATIWTSAEAGIVENGVLIVHDGRIAYAGPADGAPARDDERELDASNLHITPGLIDAHSHTGVSGSVNEVGERVTAEVRIEDCIDPDDINWYRQLAGGLTAANQLHGSANAIGGQNSVVKLRWGVAHPDDMRLETAMPGIKFALGENPKRVAAGTDIADEYPQSRMGVATLIEDRLAAGRHYRAAWERFGAMTPSERRRAMPPRRDLELEAMAEIVASERWIHCHSYRQDEILMLARLAQQFGIKIGTFQHVLEGYKVAEAVRDAAVGGSTFSDWWAYKFEVIDAIPHNAALMTQVGANVSINSDSNEHARRLNTEAAKSMKYGGLSPEQSLALVTINPAIQLGIDDRVGSLEVGKDADFAIWSGDPLKYSSRCTSTWIDGREYFSLERDAEHRRLATAERQRLIQKILAKNDRGGDRGGRDRRGGPPADDDHHDEDGHDGHENHAHDVRTDIHVFDSGLQSGARRGEPGDCGCGDWIGGAR